MTGVPLPRAGADPGGGRCRLHDHVVVTVNGGSPRLPRSCRTGTR